MPPLEYSDNEFDGEDDEGMDRNVGELLDNAEAAPRPRQARKASGHAVRARCIL